MKRILIVEDDAALSRGIAFAFRRDGYETVAASTARQARDILEAEEVDIVLLDVGLPDGDGMDLCQQIRARSDTPVIMLTARDMETDVVSGLLAGADDYVTKPFSLSILRARVEALLRRAAPDRQGGIRSGPFRLDTRLCRLYRDEEEIPVSATEYRLLAYLMANAGQVLTKEQILAEAWDANGLFVDENTLQVNISRLRAKIEPDPRRPQVIKTVHGMGYMWNGGR